MNFALFDSLPMAVIYIGLVLILLFAFELGNQVIRRNSGLRKGMEPNSLGAMVGGLIAILGFLLAFTFSIATSQFTLRRQYVLEEAMHIGTAYLRADLVEEEYKNEVKKLLRDYVDTRLDAVKSLNINTELEKSVKIHGLLWDQVAEVARAYPGENTAMLAQSVNNVIDMHEKRVTAGLRSRIPSSIWITLLAISFMTMFTVGVKAGVNKNRLLVAVIPMILAFAAIFTLNVDLNRPQKGLLKVSQESMISLQKSMQADIK